ncbi:MAG: PSD1 and planctomycete cytochrome C domain-containing protein [Planctomycetaceae bacterium]
MSLRTGNRVWFAAIACWAALSRSAPAADDTARFAKDSPTLTVAEQQFFEKQVRPLLIKHCYECHSTEAKILKGGLYLDSRAGWMKGGDSGAAIVPGDPDNSLLIDAVRYAALEMPPQGKLPAPAIAILEQWVRMGAPDPRIDGAPTLATGPDPAAGRAHWSFQPLRKPDLPRVKNEGWPHSDVDRFILAGLDAQGLTPAVDADKRTLLRRVYIDLIGIPPTPSEIETFLADSAPEAFAKVVDALLGRVEYGHCWGRHWLDVARYADSNGADENFTYYDAWRFRNYVIGAFNADKPFDRFLTEQLAGDLLPYRSQEERDENIVATGFLVVGPKLLLATDKEQLIVDVIDEQLDTIGKAFLGLSLGCARCHDHKFDPIPTRDYYAMAGILASTETIRGNLMHRADISGWNLHPLGSGGQAAYDAFLAHEQKVANLGMEQRQFKTRQEALKKAEKLPDVPAGDEKDEKEKPAVQAVTGETSDARSELQQIEERIAGIAKDMAALTKNPPRRPPLAMSVNDRERPGPIEICIRGDFRNRGESVPRGFISISSPYAPQIGPATSGREHLAAWLTSRANPLTARVAVNRVWQHLFGNGLVGTTDDFGARGDRPTHPDLLDHLALQFIDDGWSVKRLIRRLVLSRTYQMSTQFNEGAAAHDPENRWLWHMNRRRLPAEALRDGLLSISGQLDLSPATSVVAHLGPQATGVGTMPNKIIPSFQRTVYLPVVRNDLVPVFQVFDFGDAQTVTGRRSSTNVAPQALFMMNSPLVAEAATQTAANLIAGCDVLDEHGLLERLYDRILGRPPLPNEVGPSLALVREALALRTGESPAELSPESAATVRAWALLAQALFCSTNYLYLD